MIRRIRRSSSLMDFADKNELYPFLLLAMQAHSDNSETDDIIDALIKRNDAFEELKSIYDEITNDFTHEKIAQTILNLNKSIKEPGNIEGYLNYMDSRSSIRRRARDIRYWGNVFEHLPGKEYKSILLLNINYRLLKHDLIEVISKLNAVHIVQEDAQDRAKTLCLLAAYNLESFKVNDSMDKADIIIMDMNTRKESMKNIESQFELVEKYIEEGSTVIWRMPYMLATSGRSGKFREAVVKNNLLNFVVSFRHDDSIRGLGRYMLVGLHADSEMTLMKEIDVSGEEKIIKEVSVDRDEIVSNNNWLKVQSYLDVDIKKNRSLDNITNSLRKHLKKIKEIGDKI